MKRITVKVLCSLFLLLSCFGGALYAQEDSLDFEVPPVIEEESASPINRSGMGAFGKVLSQAATFISLNGFFSTQYHLQNSETDLGDDIHASGLLVNAELSEKIFVEVLIDYKVGEGGMHTHYAFIDYQFKPELIVRAGNFLTPSSDYSQNRYLPYTNKVIHPAYVNTHVTPAIWASKGLQLHGKFGGEDSKAQPYYALAVIAAPEGTESGEGIYHILGANHSHGDDTGGGHNHSHGGFGEIGFAAKSGVEFNGGRGNIGFNFATFQYDDHRELNLALGGLSAIYGNDKFTLEGELQFARQQYFTDDTETSVENRTVNGFYVLAAYKIKKLEPVIRYDQADFWYEEESVQAQRITAGINYNVYKNSLLKIHYELISASNGHDQYENRLTAALHIGF